MSSQKPHVTLRTQVQSTSDFYKVVMHHSLDELARGAQTVKIHQKCDNLTKLPSEGVLKMSPMTIRI
jgi:hypothetical protein